MTKLLIKYLFDFLIPIFYLVFIVAGFVCALISGLIEYLVVKDLFSESGLEFLKNISIPLLIVFAFEATKLFLVFYKDTADAKKGYYFSHMRWGLILFSVFCTLLFSFEKLNNPRKDEEISRQREIVEKEYQRKIDNKKERLAYWEDILDKERATGIRERYKNAEENVARISAEIEELYEQMSNKIDAIEVASYSSKQTDNRLLSSALTIWVRAIYNTDEYSPRAYIILAIILSLLISFSLEIVIYVSLRILAQTNPKSIDFIDFTSGNPTELLLLSVIPGLIIFLSLIGLLPLFNNTLHIIFVIFGGATVGIFIVNSIKSPDLIVKKVEYVRPSKVALDTFYISIAGALISTIIGVIILSIYGFDTSTKSFYGFFLAIICGFIGKISSDALAKQKVLETDKILAQIEIEKNSMQQEFENDE